MTFPSCLLLFLEFRGILKGMDRTTRKTGRHIESDPDWESAFTLQLRMIPILNMLFEWCTSDVS